MGAPAAQPMMYKKNRCYRANVADESPADKIAQEVIMYNHPG